MGQSNNIDISIIIPVYNGEKYLQRTIDALLNQTFSNFEIICVDDESTDNSLAVLEEFACKDSRVRILNKENGGTAAKAVKYGLGFAKGKYYMYSSQDDLFSIDLLEKNYRKAVELDADAIVPDMIFYADNQDVKGGIIGINGDRSNVLIGRDAFLLSLNWTIHGFVLWKMELVRRVGFEDFGINSDEYTTRMLYFNSNKVAFTDAKFYYRQDNSNSITKKWNIKLLESFDTCVRLENFVLMNKFKSGEYSGLYTTILAEILRIQRIFFLNKNNLDRKQAKVVQRQIKMFYIKYKYNFKFLHSSAFFPLYKIQILSSGFFALKAFCRLSIFYSSLKRIQK